MYNTLNGFNDMFTDIRIEFKIFPLDLWNNSLQISELNSNRWCKSYQLRSIKQVHFKSHA